MKVGRACLCHTRWQYMYNGLGYQSEGPASIIGNFYTLATVDQGVEDNIMARHNEPR